MAEGAVDLSVGLDAFPLMVADDLSLLSFTGQVKKKKCLMCFVHPGAHAACTLDACCEPLRGSCLAVKSAAPVSCRCGVERLRFARRTLQVTKAGESFLRARTTRRVVKQWVVRACVCVR